MLTKIGDVLEKLILAVVALLMGVMIVATVIAVVQRYVVGSAFNWAEEFCGYDMVWCAFLGAAVAFRHHDLVLLDLFTRMLPQKIRKAVRLITHVICLVLIAYLAYTSLRYSLSPSIFMRRCTTLPFTMFVPFVSCLLYTSLRPAEFIDEPCDLQSHGYHWGRSLFDSPGEGNSLSPVQGNELPGDRQHASHLAIHSTQAHSENLCEAQCK